MGWGDRRIVIGGGKIGPLTKGFTHPDGIQWAKSPIPSVGLSGCKRQSSSIHINIGRVALRHALLFSYRVRTVAPGLSQSEA
jgi:hypothetical protein